MILQWYVYLWVGIVCVVVCSMVFQLERSVLIVWESMVVFQWLVFFVKLDCSSIFILQWMNFMLFLEMKLKVVLSILVKDQVVNFVIRNWNVVIGLLLCLLILVVLWYFMLFEGVLVDLFDVGSGQLVWFYGGRVMLYKEFVQKSFVGGMKFLVQDLQIKMMYYNGFFLIGMGGVLKVNVIFYGGWSEKQKVILIDFVRFFLSLKFWMFFLMVVGWWVILKNYKDSKKVFVVVIVILGKVYMDFKYSLKKFLVELDIEKLVVVLLNLMGVDLNVVYLVLIFVDVGV